MKSVSIFKKIKLFNLFKRVLKSNKDELRLKFNIRVDKANRLYTVINVPEELVGEAYSMKKSDIDRISENYIKSYSNELAEYLDSKGLKELYDFYKIDKVNKYSYLIVFGFSLFKSHKYYNTIFFIILPFILSLISIGVFYII